MFEEHINHHGYLPAEKRVGWSQEAGEMQAPAAHWKIWESSGQKVRAFPTLKTCKRRRKHCSSEQWAMPGV